PHPHRRRRRDRFDGRRHAGARIARRAGRRDRRARRRLRRGLRSRRRTAPPVERCDRRTGRSRGDAVTAPVVDRPPAPEGEPVPSAHDEVAAPVLSVRAPWAIVVLSFAFVRKEVVEIVRQPRLIALLVIGPFALLVMFGFGYGNDS